MKYTEKTELTSKTETDSQIESRLTALGVGWLGGGGIEQKGLMDMDNSVVIVVGMG